MIILFAMLSETAMHKIKWLVEFVSMRDRIHFLSRGKLEVLERFSGVLWERSKQRSTVLSHARTNISALDFQLWYPLVLCAQHTLLSLLLSSTSASSYHEYQTYLLVPPIIRYHCQKACLSSFKSHCNTLFK